MGSPDFAAPCWMPGWRSAGWLRGISAEGCLLDGPRADGHGCPQVGAATPCPRSRTGMATASEKSTPPSEGTAHPMVGKPRSRYPRRAVARIDIAKFRAEARAAPDPDRAVARLIATLVSLRLMDPGDNLDDL